MFQNRSLIRYIEYRILMEGFIISAIVAILGIRVFLKLTDYPTIGGNVLHISHMLWGGLLMLIALFLTFIFLNLEVKRISSIIGGLGFGTFMDEVGKFITRDNNYFYQPSFAVMYVTFVLLYLLLHLINRNREFSEKEYLINSIEIMKDAVINDLDTQEKQKAMLYLSQANKNNTVTQTLERLYKNLDALKQPKQSIWTKSQKKLAHFYFMLVNRSWFRRSLIVFFLLQAVFSFIIAILLLIERNTSFFPSLLLSNSFNPKSFNTLHFYTTLASICFIIIGVVTIYKSRLQAFIMFKRSILISVLLSQVFAFYYNPTRAFMTLSFNILILTALNYMIDNERNLKKTTSNTEA